MRDKRFWTIAALLFAAVIALSNVPLQVSAAQETAEQETETQEDIGLSDAEQETDTQRKNGNDLKADSSGGKGTGTTDGTDTDAAEESVAPSILNYISFSSEKGRMAAPVSSARGCRSRLISLLIGYLLGMFLTAEAVTRKLTGKPCSELGDTGNPGMANVMAHLGMKPGFTVLAGDIGKTVAATLLSWVLFGPSIGRLAVLYAALGVTLGHNYPVWNRFHGGKGVATTCSGIAAFSFGWGIGADLIGALTVLLTHYLCVGAIVIPLAFLIPVFALYGTEAGIVAVVLAVLMAVKHMPAVRGIRSGETPKIDLIGKIREHKGKAQMDMEKDIVRRHILFYGRVQGVGFRYQAMYAARQYGLTGWVENLEDGTVEMEVQGTAADIRRLLTELQSGRWIRIDGMDTKDEPVQPDERSFRVRGY